MNPQRIVLSTFGSFGDVHPYIALALELKRRGHRPVLATSGIYRDKADALGLEFAAVRPQMPSLDRPDEVSRRLAKMLAPRDGTEQVIRNLVLPYLRESYEDLSAVARGADLLLTHPFPFVGPTVAEKQRLKWASSVLAPASFLSAEDPPVFAQMPLMYPLMRLHPAFMRLLVRIGRRKMGYVKRAVDGLRAEENLPPAAGHPFMEGQHSPRLVLALFSRVLAAPQPDWPHNTRVTGFAFYDRRDFFGERETPRALLDFIDAGEPPIVFTLGSSAIWAAGDFYLESFKAAQSLGRRALLLIGHEGNRPTGALPPGVAAFEYAPYGEVLPRAAAVVHQGGAGTTGQALRAGRPALVVPFAHDQFDNGARAARLGCARVLPRTRYRATTAARALNALLGDPAYAARAVEVGRTVQAEDGARTACDLLEAMLTSP
jgi:UDP:flavonoid glycosyltransferase YjiC (YdhE family)